MMATGLGMGTSYGFWEQGAGGYFVAEFKEIFSIFGADGENTLRLFARCVGADHGVRIMVTVGIFEY